MENGSKGLRTVVWTLLVGVLVGVTALFVLSRGKKSGLPVYGVVQPFTLTNQMGEVVRLRDLEGKVWVADVIFTVCAGPCPKMTEEMSKLQSTFAAAEKLRFVTLTTDPERDTPKVLQKYSEKFGANAARWHFLTGPKSEVLANLAIGSLKLSAIEKDETQRQDANDLFVHSTMFVLVDGRGQIRGFYESLEPDFQAKIGRDLSALLGESQ